MREEVQSLNRIISATPLAEVYCKNVIPGLGETLDNVLGNHIQASLKRYGKVEEIGSRLKPQPTLTAQLEVLIKTVPTFLLSIQPTLLAKDPTHNMAGRFHFAVIEYLTQRSIENQSHVKVFLDSMNHSELLTNMKARLVSKEGNQDYFPRLVGEDLALIAGGFMNIAPVKDTQLLIERYFLFQGLMQYFFRFYFQVLIDSPSEQTIDLFRHITAIMFAALRQFEKLNFNNKTMTTDKLETLINQNSAKTGHPLLKKPTFVFLNNYCPFLAIGKPIASTVVGQKVFKSQQVEIGKLSAPRMTWLLDDLGKFRGKQTMANTISFFGKKDQITLTEVQKFLTGKDIPATKSVLPMVDMVLQKNAPAEKPKVLKIKADQALVSSVVERKTKAQKNIAELADKKTMNQHQVSDYLKNRLSKLYARVRQEGAMTAQDIPKYLSKFANITGDAFSKPIMGQGEVAAIGEQAQDLLAEVAGDNPELEGKKEVIAQKVKALEGEHDEERKAEVLSSIGEDLMDAAKVAGGKATDEDKKKLQLEKVLAQEIIPIGLEPSSPRIPVGEFLGWPLAERQGPAEEDWFKFHVDYIDLAIEDKKFSPENLDHIKEILDQVPQVKFKKYFNIFPGKRFEDSVLMAVYSMWENKALNRLKID